MSSALLHVLNLILFGYIARLLSLWRGGGYFTRSHDFYLPLRRLERGSGVSTKEVNKEQPSYRNLSATATRVPQCTCPVAASRKDFSAIHTSPQTIHS